MVFWIHKWDLQWRSKLCKWRKNSKEKKKFYKWYIYHHHVSLQRTLVQNGWVKDTCPPTNRNQLPSCLSSSWSLNHPLSCSNFIQNFHFYFTFPNLKLPTCPPVWFGRICNLWSTTTCVYLDAIALNSSKLKSRFKSISISQTKDKPNNTIFVGISFFEELFNKDWNSIDVSFVYGKIHHLLADVVLP